MHHMSLGPFKEARHPGLACSAPQKNTLLSWETKQRENKVRTEKPSETNNHLPPPPFKIYITTLQLHYYYYLELSFPSRRSLSLSLSLSHTHNSQRKISAFSFHTFNLQDSRFLPKSSPFMAILVLLVLILAMTNGSGATWCVCRSDVGDSSLQKTLDYACGAGADCTPIAQNGACFQPNSVRAHCSYAVNSYFQKKGQAQGSCDFSSTAVTVATDPSPSTTCAFPSSASTTGTTPTTPPTTPTTTPTTLTPPTTPTTLTPPTTPTTTPTTPTTGTPPSTGLTPPTTTTTSPMIGGTTSSISPSGLNNDFNGAFHPRAEMGLLFLACWLLGLVLLRG